MVDAGESVTLLGDPPRFVSRGGDKLDAALDRFGIVVTGLPVLDAGSSTGGFTDCVLQRGARAVTSVDVGRGQLHQRLRADSRVTVRERTDIRAFVADHPFPCVVADLSFISLRSVAAALLGANAAVGADVVVLVKPQFEAGRAEVSRGGGVIRDPGVWATVLDQARSTLEAQDAAMMGAMVSPLRGADGNVEFLFHLRAHTQAAHGEVDAADVDLDAVVDEAASAAAALAPGRGR